MRIRRLLLFLCCFLVVNSTFALTQKEPAYFPEIDLQDLLVRQWRVDDGLPTESLTDVVRTRDGHVWISTYEGLVRFDGLRFEVFGQRDVARLNRAGGPLVAAGFFDLSADPAGGLWIGGQKGQLLRYRDGAFEIFQTTIEEAVFDLCLDREKIWVGGVSPAVVDLQREPPQIEGLAPLQGVAVEATACRGGDVWLGSNDGRLFRVDPEDRRILEEIQIEHAVDAVAGAADGSLWVGHRGGLLRRTGQRIETLEEFRGISVRHLRFDDRGDLWLATAKGLARRSAAGDIEWLDAERSGLEQADSLSFDEEENLWIAGRQGGLFQVRQGKLTALDTRVGLEDQPVDAIYEMRDGRMLIGYDQYLAIWDPAARRLTHLRMPEVGKLDVLDVMEDRGGTIWAATYTGLLRLFPDGGFLWDNVETGFPSSQIRILLEDSRGTVWLGTDNRGVIKIARPSKRSPFTAADVEILGPENGLASEFVFGIREDKKGRLLLALRGGFHLLSPDGDLETFRAGEDFSGSLVFQLTEDSSGSLWLATDAGVTRYRNQEFHKIGAADGLPTESIFDLREDDYGYFWMCSTQGISRVARAELDAFLDRPTGGSPPKIEQFGEDEGMPDRQCTGAREILKTSRGEFWFPTHGGVAKADPSNLPRSEIAPPIVIRQFRLEEEEIRRDEEISIAPGLHRYRFEFSVLGLRNPAGNRVRYFLEGFDENWKSAKGEWSASYTNLPRGNYKFRVVGANSDGVWNEKGDVVSFEVRPYYYETWPFRAGSALLVALSGAAVYRWRDREARRRLLETERRHREVAKLSEQRRELIVALQERTEEVDRFLYIFSHDFKNPLLTINSFTGTIREDLQKGEIERASIDLERIAAAADRLNRQLDDLLKIADADRVRTSPEVFPFSQIVEVAIERYRQDFERRSVRLIRSYEDTNLTLYGDRKRIAEVFEEILGNALKFLGDASDPWVEIGAIQKESEALCWVRDNGLGIDPVYHQKVFQPLTQIDARYEGTGIGLALVARVVEKHGGRVWIESSGKSEGTTAWLLLPRFDPERGFIEEETA